MALNLHEAKPFTRNDYGMLIQYLKKYKRSYARFYESPLRLMHQPHVFKWLVIDEHLCIIKKRQIMGTPVCYLILPPLGPNPLPIMRMFQENNISTMLSSEDLLVYGLDYSEVNVDKDNAEYIYHIDAFADRKGVNKNQLRRPLNRFEKNCLDEKWTLMHFHSRIPIEVLTSASALTTRWLQQRTKKAYKPNFFLEAFNSTAGHHRQLATFIMHGSRCLGYLISECTPNGIINNVCCTDYDDNPVYEPTKLLLHYQAVKWLEASVPWDDVKINRGAAVRGTGSKFAKQKLRPIAVHQNYKLRTEKLTKEAYTALWEKPVEDVEWL